MKCFNPFTGHESNNSRAQTADKSWEMSRFPHKSAVGVHHNRHVIFGDVMVFFNDHVKWQFGTANDFHCHRNKRLQKQIALTRRRPREQNVKTLVKTHFRLWLNFYFGDVSTFCPREHTHIALSTCHSSCRKTCSPLSFPLDLHLKNHKNQKLHFKTVTRETRWWHQVSKPSPPGGLLPSDCVSHPSVPAQLWWRRAWGVVFPAGGVWRGGPERASPLQHTWPG